MVQRAKRVEGTVHIALVGKYTALHDAYLSVVEALTHGGIENDVSVEIQWVDSKGSPTPTPPRFWAMQMASLFPAVFGDRGIEGMIASARYARENDVPYFGICLGMQMAVIEYARHVCALEALTQRTGSQHQISVIDIMPEQVAVTSKAAPCAWAPIPACFPRTPAFVPFTARMRSANVTATATNSTTNTARLSPAPACA